MKLPVTYLFVPGDRPERFDKAIASGADSVIIDLEDAVGDANKDRARDSVGEWVASHRDLVSRIAVRINDAGSACFAADLELLTRAGLRYAMLPKAESAAQVDRVMAALPSGGHVLALIETARGVQDVESIASANGVQRLAFGALDYGVDLDLSGDDRGLNYAGSRIALASRCAGIATPVAGVTLSLDDEQLLLADMAFARALGFGAKLCIHPRQVAAVRTAMLPTAAEVDWARRVLAVAADAHGAVQVDGWMVDRPVLRKARALLDRAGSE